MSAPLNENHHNLKPGTVTITPVELLEIEFFDATGLLQRHRVTRETAWNLFKVLKNIGFTDHGHGVGT